MSEKKEGAVANDVETSGGEEGIAINAAEATGKENVSIHSSLAAGSGDADNELFGLATDLSQTLLGWSWEGTLGLEEKVSRVVNAYSDRGDELETLVLAESAIVRLGDDEKIIKTMPGIPPLAALSAFKKWLISVEAGELTLGEARRALGKISSTEHVYHTLVRIFGVVVLSFAFAIDIVGTWEGCVVAIITGVISGIHLILAELGIAWALLMPFSAAFFVALPIMICYRYDVVQESPGLLLVSALFVFIPGDSITMQAVEIIAGRWTAGVARLFYSIMLLVLLAFGALLAAGVTGVSATDLDPVSDEPIFPFWAIYPGHVLFTIGTAFAFQMRARDMPLATIVTLLTTAVAQGFTALLGEEFGTFLGSIFMVIFSCFAARKPDRSPSYVFILTPFFTLTPGSHGLRGFEAVVSGDVVTGYDDFWSLIEVLITIAIGIVGGFLVTKKLGWA